MDLAMKIVNGTVINPYTNTVELKDILIRNGKITDELSEISYETIDAKGCFITSGLIDMHVHVFEEKTSIGIKADLIGVEQGVTTVVDAGSSGINNFMHFKQNVIDKNKTEVLYFINLSKKGLCENLSELASMDDLMTLEELINFMSKETGLCGIKVRMSSSVVKHNGLKPLIYARKLSSATGLPLMVHIGNAPPILGDILNLLQKGDIVTHFLHGKKGGVLDFFNEFKQALVRGVNFDVGHGSESFSFETAKKIIAKLPVKYSISTDLYNKNYDSTVKSLFTTITKFLCIGLTLEQAIEKVTKVPSEVLGIKDAATLEVGSKANLTLFKVENQQTELLDSEGTVLKYKKTLIPYAVIRNGKRVENSDKS